MKDNVTRALGKLQSSFGAFTAGQKVVALVGTGALLLAGFMVFKWAAAPSYAPLFSDLAPADASAIVEELDAQGVPYELSNGGNTILVPREQVYSTRISLSGEGLPTASGEGYSLLDNQGLSTSEFQEQTSFKRAMEGELSNTIEAIDSVDTAVVHLAIPQKEVFSDEQAPTTASVLVKTGAGDTLDPEQVQAIVNLVSSSVDGLAEDKVTVADSTGKVLSAPGGAGGAGGASTQTQQVQEFEGRLNSQVQALLDRVVGPGNSAVQIRADLSFDKSLTETTRYFGNADTALSETETSEILQGGDPNATAGGVLGPDGQMDGNATGDSAQNYEKSSRTSDNAVNKEVSTVEAAPGGVNALHVGIVVDPRAPSADAAALEELVAAALGVNVDRGDTIEVTSMAFDRTAEETAAAELEASEKEEKDAATWTMIRNGGLALLVVIIAIVAWFQSRRRSKARAQATEYVVEQLRQEALERQQRAALEAPAMLALETAEASEEEKVREEIASLVERQPEDVAALLRGWLVETR